MIRELIKKISPHVCTLVGIILCSVFVSTVYLKTKLERDGGTLVPAVINYFPWTDMAENVIIGFNLANNAVFEVDTVVMHMPGVPQYLSLYFKLFGLNKGTPSPELAQATYVVAAFATTVFAISCLFIALVLLEFSKKSALTIATSCILLSGYFKHTVMPMSETLIPPLLLLQIIIFYKIIFTSNVARRFCYSVWSLSALPLINVLLGLTLLPTVFFLAAVILVYNVWLHTIKKEKIPSLLHPLTLLPIAISIAIITYELITLNLQALYFWNYTVPKIIVANYSPSLQVIFSPWYNFLLLTHRHYPGGNIWELLGIAICCWTVITKYDSSDKTKPAFFILSCLIAGLLTQWRAYSDCFKGALPYAITWAIFFIIVKYLPYKIMIEKITARVSIPIVAAGFFMLIQFINLINIDIYKDHLPARSPVFNKAEVCRFRDTSPTCRCLQVASFGPQIFLETDVRQCVNRYSSFAMALFYNEVNMANLIKDINSPYVAFLVFPQFMLELAEKHRFEEIINYFYNSPQKCLPYDTPAKLCYNGPPSKP